MATVSDLIDQARLELIDTGPSPRWTDAEFVGFYNQFLREVPRMAPSRVSRPQDLTFNAGARQDLPASVSALVSIIRNKNGRSCTPFDLETLQRFDPSWVEGPTAATVFQYAYSPALPRTVYVNPPLSGTCIVEALVAPVLPPVATKAEAVVLADDVIPAALNYMLYRACFKDAEDTAMAAKATHYLSRAMQLLGVSNGDA